MSGASPCLLAINGGSSSIRFAVYEAGKAPRRRLSGTIDRIGQRGASLTVDDQTGKGPRLPGLAGANHLQAAEVLLDWLEAQPVFASVKAVGHRSFGAVLGGLDTLIFAGGIGENAAAVRERICAGLGFLGIDIDQKQNSENAAIISDPTGRVTLRVMRTDEELMIARATTRVLKLASTPPRPAP